VVGSVGAWAHAASMSDTIIRTLIPTQSNFFVISPLLPFLNILLFRTQFIKK